MIAIVDAPPTEDYRDLLDRVFDDRVTAWTAEAEETEQFPRKLIEYLGESGVFAAKWPAGEQQVDVAKVIELARRLAQLGSAGIGVGVGLHDSAIAVLRRFGKSDYLKDIAEKAIRGEAVLCIGASEESGGSDLQIVGTEVRSVRDGFEVKGIKKFVSLSPIADHVIAVARSIDHDPDSKHGSVAVIAVPLAQCEIQTPYRKVGAGPLATAAVHIDTWVPDDALVARAGIGLAAISWGLAQERMSVAGLISTSAQRVIGITLARMMTRTVRSHPLRTPGAQIAHRRPSGARRHAALCPRRHRGDGQAGSPHRCRHQGHRGTPRRRGDVGVHAHLRRLRLSGRRDTARTLVARHETRARRRWDRRGAVGAGCRGDEARLRRLR
jgi:alkylation response protein AidB-like acyl-CoA dehydrogenase